MKIKITVTVKLLNNYEKFFEIKKRKSKYRK